MLRSVIPFLTCFVAAALLTEPANAQFSFGGPQLVARHLVDIGSGRHMNIVCMGHGSPTVVFEYGLGGHMLNWQ